MNKVFTYKNGDLAYQDHGRGDVVVLIHGFAEDGDIFSEITTALAQENRVIVPDLPGSGRSSPVENVSIESMADSVYLLLKNERIADAVIIGHSMGGYVSLAFAEKYPEYITRLGLFHSTAFADSEEKIATRKKNNKFMETHGSHEFLKQAIPGLFSPGFKEAHPEIIDALIERYKGFSPAVLIGYYEAMIKRPDRTQVLKDFEKPVLFILGKYDNAVPLEDGLKLCHLPSLSYIHILENSGHMGMLEEQDRSIEILKNFIKILPE